METLLFILFCSLFYKCICDGGTEKRINMPDEADATNEVILDKTPEIERTGSLTCISCNNVEKRACSNPANRELPTEKCPDSKDVCFSMHTPFGIVKRGCFNPNRKQIFYFCSCDLCNDTPMNLIVSTKQFTDKKKWIDNVAEISHARRLRLTVRNSLKCLSCEVKGHEDKTLNPGYYESCILGNYEPMEIRYCSINEVCGIRVIKNEGAVMRGCVAGPLYNYLYSFCNSDNCNDEPVVSVYDPIKK